MGKDEVAAVVAAPLAEVVLGVDVPAVEERAFEEAVSEKETPELVAEEPAAANRKPNRALDFFGAAARFVAPVVAVGIVVFMKTRR